MSTEASYTSLGPALCVAAQGAKAIMLGRDVFEYDPTHLLVFAVDLPVSSQVIRASRKDPYLGFTLELDPVRIAELAGRVYPRGIPKARELPRASMLVFTSANRSNAIWWPCGCLAISGWRWWVRRSTSRCTESRVHHTIRAMFSLPLSVTAPSCDPT
jgi:hypothetical protein